MRVNAIAHLKKALDALGNSSESKQINQRISQIICHPLAAEHFAIALEQVQRIGMAAQQPFPHKHQVGVQFARAVREEQLLAQPIDRAEFDVLQIPLARVPFRLCHRPAETLRQIRVAVRPIQNTRQQRRGGIVSVRNGFRVAPLQPKSQLGRFLAGKIVQLDPPPDVERCQAGVPNQISGSRDPQQAEGQPIEFRSFRTTIVTLANRGEEFIRRKRQTADGVDFIEKNHGRPRAPGQHRFANGREPALHRA